jgi:hypothetical protein
MVDAPGEKYRKFKEIKKLGKKFDRVEQQKQFR